MKVSVRLLPLKGKVIEEDIEIPLVDGSSTDKVIKAALPVIRAKMPMAGYSTFVNNLSFKEEYARFASFHPDDVLTVMEIPLSVVMP